ncbi:MAG: ABC transporter ATP-binding protein [Ferrovum sp.]|nr:ABC transporter ATP-binding protein [Ferrovum sp.]NDU87845.1 ABC transporter ATP-binding protein [Ferrovum sp.]
MLEIEGLEAGYGPVRVLHGISLKVPKGRVVTLIGANGAGKSTTLRAVSGMIQPTAGQVRLAGKNITGLPAHRVAQAGLAHSPEGRRIFPNQSVRDNLILGAYTRLTFGHSRPRGDISGDFERALDLFPRLRERQYQLAGTLSGGEQQMLAMARALMLNPDVLLLDEPSLGLAPVLVEEVFHIIRRLKSEGITMLLVEQFAHAALAVADYGFVMENGRIVLEGSATELQRDEQVKSAYLGH